MMSAQLSVKDLLLIFLLCHLHDLSLQQIDNGTTIPANGGAFTAVPTTSRGSGNSTTTTTATPMPTTTLSPGAAALVAEFCTPANYFFAKSTDPFEQAMHAYLAICELVIVAQLGGYSTFWGMEYVVVPTYLYDLRESAAITVITENTTTATPTLVNTFCSS